MISDDTRRRFDELVKRYPEKRSVLIPMLHEVQAEVGYLSPEAVEWVAGYLGLSPADVMSVASFYDMLNLEPVGRHMIYVCHNLTCSLLGVEGLIRHLEATLGIRMGETTPHGDARVQMAFEKILTRYQDIPNYTGTIGEYIAHGGYQALPKALREFRPADLIETVKRSGLRGRGGAGFPCGVKWGFIPKDSPKAKYLVCNCDESEPGTFKDRMLVEEDPHQLIEGIVISSYAIGCHLAFIYCRGEFVSGAKALERALGEAFERGFLGKDILGSGFDLRSEEH